MDAVHLSLLVLDSDLRTLNFLAAYLSRFGHSVTTAQSAREGYIAALRDKPDAIIFDPNLPDMPGVDFMRRLRNDRRTTSTFCIALAAQPNPTLLNALLAAGCNEFLVKTPEVFEKLQALLTHPTQTPFTPAQQGGRLVVFLSAKGGTGTSSLCANIAQNIAETQPEMEVAVIDLVLPLGSIGPIVGYDEGFSLAKAAAEDPQAITAEYMRQNLPRLSNWRFRLLAGVDDPETANQIDATRIPALIQAARQAFDLTLVDLGRSLSRISLPVILAADQVMLILSADLSTITLSRKIWDYLQIKGLQHRHIYPLLNRVVGPEGLSKSDAERLLGLKIEATIPYMMGNLTLSNNQHVPVLKHSPNDTAALMVSQVSRDLIRRSKE